MMNNRPYFSVIIPTYNRADFITRTIESILTQSFADFEIIVVDDGSTDATEKIISTIDDIRLQYIKKTNAERAAARNEGVAQAKGRYVTFLDSDDIAYPNHLSTAFDFLSVNHLPEVFHVGYEIIRLDGSVLKKIDRLNKINKEIIQGNPLSCIGVFVREDVMRKNLFNEDRDLSGLEDWELWLRMGASHKFLACHDITAAMIQHDDRSVIDANLKKLLLRTERFIRYVSSDPNNQLTYGRQLSKTVASAMTYTALHLALAKANKREVWHYLKMGILGNPFELMRKRFFVILKLTLLW